MTRPASTGAPPRQAGREVELSLVVTGPDPESVLGRLARLRKFDPYVLRARGSEHLVDRYYDLPDRRLRQRGLALRLRVADGSALIGVKGRRRSASTQTEDRFERELPFSAEAVLEIARRVGVKPHPDVALSGEPEAVLTAALGLQRIQQRETVRLVRDVVDERHADGPPLAELVLDRVHFRLEGREVRHYEVEVEAKRSGDGTKAAKAIAADLVSRYPGELEDWPYGKLPTGMAIEDLLLDGALEIGPDGALTPAAYERIKRYIEAESG